MSDINKKVKKKFPSTAMKQAIKITTRRELEDLLDREAERQKMLEYLKRDRTVMQSTIKKMGFTIKLFAGIGIFFFVTTVILGVMRVI